MPTKTRKPGNRTDEIAGRIRDLEHKRERAASMVLEADNEAAEIKRRQDEIAVAAVSEEPEALEEMGVLEETLLTAVRRGGVARSAVEQLGAQIEQAKEDLVEEHKRIARERFEELAKERHALEERLEEQLGTLLGGLAELRDLDQAQRLESYAAGQADAFATHVLADTVANWLAGRLGGHGGFLPGVTTFEHYKEHTLAELDVLARPLERG